MFMLAPCSCAASHNHHTTATTCLDTLTTLYYHSSPTSPQRELAHCLFSDVNRKGYPEKREPAYVNLWRVFFTFGGVRNTLRRVKEEYVVRRAC